VWMQRLVDEARETVEELATYAYGAKVSAQTLIESALGVEETP